MFRGIDGVLLNSGDAKALADFYENKVGLELTNTFDGENEGKGYEFGFKDGPGLLIQSHSEVHGKNTTPQRMFINLEVNDIEKAAAKLEEAGVVQTQEIYHVEGYGLVATYEDPDGNYFQLVQVRPTESE